MYNRSKCYHCRKYGIECFPPPDIDPAECTSFEERKTFSMKCERCGKIFRVTFFSSLEFYCPDCKKYLKTINLDMKEQNPSSRNFGEKSESKD